MGRCIEVKTTNTGQWHAWQTACMHKGYLLLRWPRKRSARRLAWNQLARHSGVRVERH
jgi:hypothetical protein